MSAEARAALDRLVEEPRPCTMDKARDAFLALTSQRDALRGRARRGEDVAAELLRVNSAIALVWSAVMPMTGFRPGRLEKARAALGEG